MQHAESITAPIRVMLSVSKHLVQEYSALGGYNFQVDIAVGDVYAHPAVCSDVVFLKLVAFVLVVLVYICVCLRVMLAAYQHVDVTLLEQR